MHVCVSACVLCKYVCKYIIYLLYFASLCVLCQTFNVDACALCVYANVCAVISSSTAVAISNLPQSSFSQVKPFSSISTVELPQLEQRLPLSNSMELRLETSGEMLSDLLTRH